MHEFASAIRKKKQNGENTLQEKNKLIEWREKILSMEQERAANAQERKQRLEAEREQYLRNKHLNLDFSGKLYEIAQSNPKLWREIKEELWKKQYEESLKYLNQPELGQNMPIYHDEQAGNYDVAQLAIQKVQNDLGGKIAEDTKAREEVDPNLPKLERRAKNSKACLIF